MKDEYDFSDAKRGVVVPLSASQTEVRVRLDNDIFDWLREHASKTGGGNYQEMLNAVLRTYHSDPGAGKPRRSLRCASGA